MRASPRIRASPASTQLADGRDALAARLALADAAQRSLDVQYFIWNKDLAGKVLLERLFRAADRGVRVRLLLDDLGTMPSDATLLTIDSHPNIEVRMFNPVALRSPRLLGMIADLVRINKRMHNKSFIADGQVAIVGGRNIGDEYFGANEAMNFADLDVAVIGPVVREVSDEFDLYWNHRASIPIAALSRQNTTSEEFAAKRATLTAFNTTAEYSAYAESVRDSEFARQLKNHAVSYSWGRATIVSDHPDKVLTSAAKTETHLAPKLRQVVDATKRELFLVSPYFVPGKQGVELLASVRRRGARVVVITNSLASTDGVPVHSKYQLYRKSLLRAGVELYETQADRWPTGATIGRLPRTERIGQHGLAREDVRLRPPDWLYRLLQSRSALEQAEHGDGCSLRLSGAREASARNDRARSRPQRVSRGTRGKPPRVGDSRGWQGSPLRLRARSQSWEAHQGPCAELAADREPALSILPSPPRRSHAPFSSLRSSRCCSLLRIALTLDPHSKVEINELTTFVQTSGVRTCLVSPC